MERVGCGTGRGQESGTWHIVLCCGGGSQHVRPWHRIGSDVGHQGTGTEVRAAAFCVACIWHGDMAADSLHLAPRHTAVAFKLVPMAGHLGLLATCIWCCGEDGVGGAVMVRMLGKGTEQKTSRCFSSDAHNTRGGAVFTVVVVYQPPRRSCAGRITWGTREGMTITRAATTVPVANTCNG